ncbi:MAG: signal peptidase I [Ignavibacteriales bacterium]|nr:signal peptidase I [Ignavibacteriales bacterium]
MNWKNMLRRFVGIKTEEELNRPPKEPKERAIDFAKSLLFAGVAALFIITFLVQNTRIPTGSMEDTILVGDFVLVNKFVYGASSPRYIPFTEVALPYFTLPGFADPERGDIVVFEYPGDRDEFEPKQLNVNYVKRLVGMPGDTIVIRDKVVFVNGEEAPIPPYVKYLSPKPHYRHDPRLFPRGSKWNEDNYGPLVIPKKGDTLRLDSRTAYGWKTIIDRELGEPAVSIQNGVVRINGKPADRYVFKKDYYFFMGDNRDDSMDSRFWGPAPDDLVVGKAFIVLFSWDRDIPFTQPLALLGSIRLERVLKLID